MPVSLLKTLVIFLQACLFIPAACALEKGELDAAREVIARTVPELEKSPRILKLEALPRQNGCDVFETESSGGILTTRGISAMYYTDNE